MGARRKYKWEELFDHPRTILVRGKDYNCSQSSMSAMIRNAASHRRVKIRLQDTGDSIIVEVVNAIQHTDPTSITA